VNEHKPFLFHTSVDGSNHRAQSVWLIARQKVRINTSRWHHFGHKPDDVSAKTEHFYDGRWREVLPYHRIEATGENETPAAHLALAARTIEFLDA
jgi:hypothetical protein